MVKTFRFEEFGFEVQTGKVANQADGAVWLQHGGTIVLATVVAAPTKDFPGFMPLTIDYRELYSAAGKIPGGYFKREGKPSDKEVLTSRLIDRAIRPLFPHNFFEQVQLLSTVYSVDKEHAPNTIALVAASLALTISDIPFLGPVGAVEICRIDGKWVVNPSYPDTKRADAKLVVAGTEEGINMVEGSADHISEEDFIDALFLAHDQIKKIVAWQKQIKEEIGKSKRDIEEAFDWNTWSKRADSFLTQERVGLLFTTNRETRSENMGELKQEFLQEFATHAEEEGVPDSVILYALDNALKPKITNMMIESNKRVDDRPFDKVRKITVEVGVLPFTHGSSLFTRGRTQALVSTTLGGGQDEQRLEGLMEEESTGEGRFMLHYNFPPFSVGDVRPMRGPGRREVGHGHLAASALRSQLPSKEEFPYTIRVVADMLESDGSTSMATTCGATMALMHAGVPIKHMVSGIAMGLIRNENGEFRVLSDILGFEDAFGLMDFKVTGTELGITAIQMDIKYKGGLPREIFEAALEQSRKGRMHILDIMKETMSKPSASLSDLVPKLVSFKIDTDKIGAVIGSGGKTIREIIETTKTEIDIEADGLVKIFGGPDSDQDRAVNWVKTLAGQIDVGSVYDGTIRRIVDFGIFVELVPGQDGLVHISNIPKHKQRTMAKDYVVGDPAKVEVVGYDRATGRIRLRILEK